MTDKAAMAANDIMAAAEPRFVAPELVQETEAGPYLIGGKCGACEALSFPLAQVCSECLSEDIRPITLDNAGQLYSFSVVHQAPKGWTVPYALGYVDLPSGLRVLAHIDAPLGQIEIDCPVRLDIADVGVGPDGAVLKSYVFRPVAGADHE